MPTTSLESQAVLIIPTAQGTDAIKRRIQLHKSILVWEHLFRHLTSPQDQAWECEYLCDQPRSDFILE